MGTPCSLIIIKNNKEILNKFFHFDGYFKYAGKQIIEFLKRNDASSIDDLIKRNCNFLSDEEVSAIYDKYMIPIGNGLCTPNPKYNWSKDYPGLDERTSVGDFLEMLEKGPRFDFSNDSNVYSRYSYIINIDDGTFTYRNNEEITVTIQELIKSDFNMDIFTSS